MSFSKFNPVSEKKRKARIRKWVANATPAIAGIKLHQASLRFYRYKFLKKPRKQMDRKETGGDEHGKKSLLHTSLTCRTNQPDEGED
jgi:hypothetical protein